MCTNICFFSPCTELSDAVQPSNITLVLTAALTFAFTFIFIYYGTSSITSIQPSKLHLDIGYVPPTDTGSLCLAVDSTRTAIPGLFRSLVRQSGTHCQMNSEIRRVMLTASNSSSKQSCSAFTSATSALEVNF